MHTHLLPNQAQRQRRLADGQLKVASDRLEVPGIKPAMGNTCSRQLVCTCSVRRRHSSMSTAACPRVDMQHAVPLRAVHARLASITGKAVHAGSRPSG